MQTPHAISGTPARFTQTELRTKYNVLKVEKYYVVLGSQAQLQGLDAILYLDCRVLLDTFSPLTESFSLLSGY